jgi:iron(III) transport system substrate-binding protein
MIHQRRTSRRGALAALALGSAALLTFTACGASPSKNVAAAAAVSKTAQQACDAASANGGSTFNYWTSTDPDVFKQEIVPFTAKYPNVKINYTSLRPSDMVQRIVSELQARHPLDVDAVAGDLPSFAPLFDQKLIQPVDWTKLGVPADVQFSLKGFTAVRTYRTVLGLGYNTKLVQESELPSTWQQLIDPKWSGKVIVDPRGVYMSGLALAMGKDQAVTYFKSLLKTDNPMIVKGATASMQKVISGEAKLSTSAHDSEAAEAQSKGAPVGIKYLDIVPTQDWYAMVLKGAQHSDAAACYLSWWTSAEGQAQQLKYEFKSNKTTPAGLPAGAKLEAINDTQQADLATEVATTFAKLMS